MTEKPVEHRPRPTGYSAIAAIWLQLAVTDVGLRLFPERYGKRLAQSPADGDVEPSHADIPVEIWRIMSDVRCAAGHPLWFNMSCLRRSLVLQKLLEKRGIHVSITFGVKKGHVQNIRTSHSFMAHAWLTVVSPVQYSGLQLDLSSIQENYSRLGCHG